MNEEDLLYKALTSPRGLVVRADKVRLQRARSKLTKNDPAMLELTIIGPDPRGQLYVLRNDKARESGL